jgi:glutamate-1-semialdehyde 2,1-aminomutase
MFTLFFREEAPSRFSEVLECDLAAFARFFRAALNEGVYLPPSQFEAAFLPARLTDDQVTTIGDSLASSIVAALVD